MHNYVEDEVLGIVQANINKTKIIYKKSQSEISKLRDSIATLKKERSAINQLLEIKERELQRILEGA